jgi:sulfide:quinone oxidoreductase
VSGSSVPAGQTVLILGGGVGGVATANRLRKRLDRRHRVILVNREPDFTFAASLLWVMTGSRRPGQIQRPLSRLERRGIEVVIGDVEAIDPEACTARVAGRELRADHLVIALGADFATDAVPGLAASGLTYATLPGAIELAGRLPVITSGRVLVVTAAPLYRCPAAPYEAALLIDAGLRARGVRNRVELIIHAAEPAPMGVAGPNASARVKQLLVERAIPYTPSHQIAAAEAGVAHFADGAEVTADLIVYMPGITPPAVIADSALAGPAGWIEVDRHTLATAFPGVYAIGDNTAIPLTIGKPLPRAGVFAHAQAEVVADRIADAINGKLATAEFDGHGGCFIETGNGRAGWGSGNFYADPAPAVAMKPPARRHHWAKVLFELRVIWRWL